MLRKKQRCKFADLKNEMNDTINYIAADTIGMNCSDTLVQTFNQYKDFKFVTENSGVFEGPKEREVSYVSAGWNFTILFVMMLLIVLNKFFAPQRFASIITMPFQSGGGDKMIRENHSSLNIISLSIVASFILMISLLIQKFFVIYGGNHILHDNSNFFLDISSSVTLLLIFDYLLMVFFGWLFKTNVMQLLYVSLRVSVMATASILLVPIVMLILFYPYKFLLIIALILLLIFMVIRLTKLLIEIRMLTKLNFVNIFLYLCTIEILPLLVIFKMVLNVL
ncbi:MAG: DUF4271 domain-containing protein [Bacteroidales bacterium]|nr:DUF4271 domain-containing protein [Bacteroidales bacterium]